MSLLEYVDDQQVLEIEYDSTTFLTATSAPIRSFLTALGELHRRTNLQSFNVVLAGNGNYSYDFESQDGRTWSQTLDPRQHNMYMTFDVPSFWKLDEFEP